MARAAKAQGRSWAASATRRLFAYFMFTIAENLSLDTAGKTSLFIGLLNMIYGDSLQIR